MNTIRNLMILLVTGILLLGAAGCSPRSTPPGPDIAAGVYVNAAYEFFHWEQGLNLMIWHDAIQASGCDSSGSTGDPAHIVDCQAISATGQRFDWQIKTVDGLTAEISINGEPYDLSEGNIFIVRTGDGNTDILQLNGDLSEVNTQNNSIVDYGLGHPEIGSFIQSTSEE